MESNTVQSSRGRTASAAATDGWRPRTEMTLVSVAAAVTVVGLVALAALVARAELVYVLVPIGAAAYLLMMSVLGAERTAIVTLMGAFATAPMYKGLAPSVDSPITPTDVLFALGFLLLVPTFATRRVRLPALYLGGVAVVFVTGCIASIVSADPLRSFISLTLWMMVMGGLPITIALWQPGRRVIEILAWSYVGGHLVSIAYAFVDGPSAQDRYGGLAAHPNYFAQASLMSIALLLYLFYRHRWLWPRLVVLGAGAACAAAILMSGSRAATVVAAVLVMMIPVVERSAITGFVYALLAALAVISLPLLVDITGEQSSLGRLAGNQNSSLSDQARSQGLDAGWDRFWAHPFTGDGLLELFDIHNNFLEVAVAIGIFGLAGYLLVLYSFARPLFGDGEHRRLCYTAWAYIGFGATIPSLYDRSIWGPVALSIVAVLGASARDSGPPEPFSVGGPTTTTRVVAD